MPTSGDGLAAWLPSANETFFGVDRTERVLSAEQLAARVAYLATLCACCPCCETCKTCEAA